MLRTDQEDADQTPNTNSPPNTASAAFEIHLFVNGKSATAARVTERLQKLLAEFDPENCCLTVIDVAEDPSVLEAANILVIPTLLRMKPEPVSRIVGDMSDSAKLIESLFPGKTHPLN